MFLVEEKGVIPVVEAGVEVCRKNWKRAPHTTRGQI